MRNKTIFHKDERSWLGNAVDERRDMPLIGVRYIGDGYLKLDAFVT